MVGVSLQMRRGGRGTASADPGGAQKLMMANALRSRQNAAQVGGGRW